MVNIIKGITKMKRDKVNATLTTATLVIEAAAAGFKLYSAYKEAKTYCTDQVVKVVNEENDIVEIIEQ